MSTMGEPKKARRIQRKRTKEREFYSRRISHADELLLEEFRKFDDRKMQAEAAKRGGKIDVRRKRG